VGEKYPGARFNCKRGVAGRRLSSTACGEGDRHQAVKGGAAPRMMMVGQREQAMDMRVGLPSLPRYAWSPSPVNGRG